MDNLGYIDHLMGQEAVETGRSMVVGANVLIAGFGFVTYFVDTKATNGHLMLNLGSTIGA